MLALSSYFVFDNEYKMEKETNISKSNRPKKLVLKNRILSLKCSNNEEEEIRRKAALYQLPISVFLRECALKNKVQIRTLPSQVVLLQTRINQICSLVNQLARKKNRNEQLTVIERSELSSIVEELHEMVITIRKYIYDN